MNFQVSDGFRLGLGKRALGSAAPGSTRLEIVGVEGEYHESIGLKTFPRFRRFAEPIQDPNADFGL